MTMTFNAIVTEEKLKPEDTRKFMENAFRDGEIKTAGTDLINLCHRFHVLAVATGPRNKVLLIN